MPDTAKKLEKEAEAAVKKAEAAKQKVVDDAVKQAEKTVSAPPPLHELNEQARKAYNMGISSGKLVGGKEGK